MPNWNLTCAVNIYVWTSPDQMNERKRDKHIEMKKRNIFFFFIFACHAKQWRFEKDVLGCVVCFGESLYNCKVHRQTNEKKKNFFAFTKRKSSAITIENVIPEWKFSSSSWCFFFLFFICEYSYSHKTVSICRINIYIFHLLFHVQSNKTEISRTHTHQCPLFSDT